MMSTWELDRLESSLGDQEPSDMSALPGAGYSTTSLITTDLYVFLCDSQLCTKEQLSMSTQ
jgi:hypothetical protein